jgi:hypothetical protein
MNESGGGDDGGDGGDGGQEGAEALEQGDEALDDATRLDPDFLEEVEQDPSLDPSLQIDDRELEEAGVKLDDPESMASLEGGMDDPDGIDERGKTAGAASEDEDGWDLDAPLGDHDANEDDDT